MTLDRRLKRIEESRQQQWLRAWERFAARIRPASRQFDEYTNYAQEHLQAAFGDDTAACETAWTEYTGRHEAVRDLDGWLEACESAWPDPGELDLTRRPDHLPLAPPVPESTRLQLIADHASDEQPRAAFAACALAVLSIADGVQRASPSSRKA